MSHTAVTLKKKDTQNVISRRKNSEFFAKNEEFTHSAAEVGACKGSWRRNRAQQWGRTAVAHTAQQKAGSSRVSFEQRCCLLDSQT